MDASKTIAKHNNCMIVEATEDSAFIHIKGQSMFLAHQELMDLTAAISKYFEGGQG